MGKWGRINENSKRIILFSMCFVCNMLCKKILQRKTALLLVSILRRTPVYRCLSVSNYSKLYISCLCFMLFL